MPTLIEVTGQVIALLEPFESQERHRIIQGALVLLGESPLVTPKQLPKDSADDGEDSEIASISAQAKRWMKQNNISDSEIEQLFHINNGVSDVIASVPGKSENSKTVNSYILAGINSFLISGDTRFNDDSARALCIKAGCYDAKNHATYVKGLGNKLTGSKVLGWSLTIPGLSAAAILIREMTKEKK